MYKHLYECNTRKAAQERVILSDKEERRQAKGPVNREDIERELSDIWFSSFDSVVVFSFWWINEKVKALVNSMASEAILILRKFTEVERVGTGQG